MNPELEIQDGIYEDLAELLEKADSLGKAGAFFVHYFQGKMNAGIIDMFDYQIVGNEKDGFTATVEFSFQWNVNNTCSMIVIPRDNPAKAYDRAMSIV